MTLKTKTPCKQCPYRKDSLNGWLGDSSGDPELFLEQLNAPDAHPCHMKVDWTADDLEEAMMKAHKCIGSLQFMNNSLMRSRYRDVMALQDQVGKNDEIMQFKSNFIKHHIKGI